MVNIATFDNLSYYLCCCYNMHTLSLIDVKNRTIITMILYNIMYHAYVIIFVKV